MHVHEAVAFDIATAAAVPAAVAENPEADDRHTVAAFEPWQAVQNQQASLLFEIVVGAGIAAAVDPWAGCQSVVIVARPAAAAAVLEVVTLRAAAGNGQGASSAVA